MVRENNIFHMVINKGASTCIMFVSYWGAIGSPLLTTSLKAFNGHTFQPYGILTTFPIDQGGHTISIDVKVVYSPLEYNLLLEYNWFSIMKGVFLLVFWILHIPH